MQNNNDNNYLNVAPLIQWFPGHMTKTKRMIEKNLSMVDIIIELTDARIPKSSKNPEIDKWINNKPRLILLNKASLADKNITKLWLNYYKKNNIKALAVDCKTNEGIKSFIPAVREILAEKIERWEAKGMVKRPIRMMIVGVPNVGKSSFINRLAGEKRAKVEDRPGVTRGQQWIGIADNIDLLDTPGVLWPKFEDPLVGEKLAFSGAVKDTVIDIEHLAMRLLVTLYTMYPERINERYKLKENELSNLEAYEMLKLVGKKRGMLVSGGEIDIERIAITIVDEYRGGKIGKITFEKPEM